MAWEDRVEKLFTKFNELQYKLDRKQRDMLDVAAPGMKTWVDIFEANFYAQLDKLGQWMNKKADDFYERREQKKGKEPVRSVEKVESDEFNGEDASKEDVFKIEEQMLEVEEGKEEREVVKSSLDSIIQNAEMKREARHKEKQFKNKDKGKSFER